MMTEPVLLYDGSCGFCNGSVQLVLRHDVHGTLRFAPLQGTFGGAARARHPAVASADSVIWLEPATATAPERALVRSDAALRVARYLGGFWRLLLIGYLVPRPIRDALYDFVARHRHRIPMGVDRCDLPTADAAARFLVDGDDA
jgi:predicted DCC family thiol-disulfide oxidoreductase YuxK